MSRGILDTCRDHKFVTTCQKQHRQNEPAGGVDVPTRVEDMCEGESWTCRDHRCVKNNTGTTDISLPVKNNTDRMNQLVR